MGHWRRQTEHWLASEELGEGASDDMLGRVFAALPPVQPSQDFARHAVQAVWQRRARQRRVTAVMTIAASVLAAASGVLAYVLLGGASGWLIGSIASVATRPAGPLLVATATAVEWWADLTRISSVIAGVVAMPQNTLTLVGIELAAGGALYALHRLLRGDGFRDPGPLCL
ncbi:MAG: hypothetical protein HOP16_11125 [Acidobacteria bacterium]|nr:hypothetical protein [Acidobacteriota bacterium]